MAASSLPEPTKPEVTSCPTHLVPDSPAEQDKFGPHAEVARAIVDLVRAEDGGRSIGLSGKWGAGKSTVIRLLRSHLDNDPAYRVWLFDAWAHEGDPLRRTFLESLITFLRKNAWVDSAHWEKRTEELARRRKLSEQRTSSRLSGIGRVLAASLFFIPFGPFLFGEGLKLGVTLSPNAGPLNVPLLFGFFLTTMPLWVALSICVFIELRYRFRVRMGRSPEWPNYGEIFAIFVQKAAVDMWTETIETPEPTSIEFEVIFRELMAEALKDKSRRLILVVDNLDRIDADEALTIWSTLQTFLQHEVPDAKWLRAPNGMNGHGRHGSA